MNDRVIFIVDERCPKGGTGIQALKVAALFQKMSVDVTVLCAESGSRIVYSEKEGGVKKSVLSLPGYRFGLYPLIKAAAVILFLILKRREYSAVYSFGNRNTYSAAVVLSILRKAFFVKILSEAYYLNIRGSRKFLFNRLCRAVAPSKHLKERITGEGIYGHRIDVIPNGIELSGLAEDRQRLRERLALGADEHVAVSVGRLIGYKDQETLLHAWRDIIKAGREARLIFLGQGPDKKRLEELSRKMDIHNSVEFRGFVNNVEEYLSAADLFVHPSPLEGCSNAVLEAMLYGLPCIATDTPGNDEIITNNKTGVLVPPKDIAGFTRAIITLLDDKPLCRALGRKAREHVLKNNSLKHTASCYLNLFKGCFKTGITPKGKA